MSEEKRPRLPADDIGRFIGRDGEAAVFPPAESPLAQGGWSEQR
jgi:hypothetical protein